MKKILKYLFIFVICFIGINNKVLAKVTQCIYESGEKNAGAYNAQNGELIAGKLKMTINVDKDGGLAPGAIFTPYRAKYTVNIGDSRTEFSKASYFIDKNKKTKCPPQIYVKAVRGNSNYMSGNLYPTSYYVSTGSFTDKQIAKMKEQYSAIDEEVKISLKKANNEGLETSVKGEYEKNQKEVNKKKLPTKLDKDSKELVGCGLFGENTLPIMKKIWRFLRFGIPVLVVILGLLDFLGIIFSGDEKYFKDAGTRFLKRLVAGVIIIFVPYVLTFLINLSGLMKDYNIETDELFCVFGGVETETVGEQAESSTRNVCQNLTSKTACDNKKSSGCSWNKTTTKCEKK